MFKRIVALIVLFFFIATSNTGLAQSNYGKKEPVNFGVTLQETIILDKAIKLEHLGKEIIYFLNIKTKSDENQIIQKYNRDKAFLNNLLEQNKDKIDLAIEDNKSNLNQKLESYLVDLTAFLSSKIIKVNNKEEYNKANEFQDGIRHFKLLSMLQVTIINYLYWKNTAVNKGNLSSEVKGVFFSYLYSNLIYLTKDNYRNYRIKPLTSILEMSNYRLPSELNTFLETFHSKTIVKNDDTTTSIEELYKNIFLNAQRINIKNYIYSYYVYKTSNSGLNIDKVAEELCRTKENGITKIAVEGLKNSSDARTGYYYTDTITEEAKYSELIIDCKQELSNFGNKYLSELKEKEKNPVTIINAPKYLGDVNRYARIVNEFNEYVKSINQVIETFNTQLKNTIHNGKYLQPSSFKTVREYRSYLENYFNGEGKGLIKDYYTSINNLSQTYPISRFIMADKGFFGMHKVFYQDPNREVEGLEEKSDFELTGEKPVYTGNEKTYIENNPDLLNYLPDFKEALKSQWTGNSQRWDDFVYQYLDEILKYGKGLSSAYNEYLKIENNQSSKINTSAKNIAEILKVQSLAVTKAVKYDGYLLDKINNFLLIDKKIKEIDANEKRKEEIHKVLGYVGLAAGAAMLATGIMSWAGAGAVGTSAAIIEGINIASMLLLTSYGYYELEVLKDKQDQLNKQIIAENIDIKKLTTLSIEVQNLKIYAVMTFAALPLDFLMIPQITGFLRTVKNIKVWNTMIDLVGYKRLDALENLTKYLGKKESTQFLMYLSDGGFDVETIIKITENNKLLKNEDLTKILKKQFHKENTPAVIELVNKEIDAKKAPIFRKTDVTENKIEPVKNSKNNTTENNSLSVRSKDTQMTIREILTTEKRSERLEDVLSENILNSVKESNKTEIYINTKGETLLEEDTRIGALSKPNNHMHGSYRTGTLTTEKGRVSFYNNIALLDEKKIESYFNRNGTEISIKGRDTFNDFIDEIYWHVMNDKKITLKTSKHGKVSTLSKLEEFTGFLMDPYNLLKIKHVAKNRKITGNLEELEVFVVKVYEDLKEEKLLLKSDNGYYITTKSKINGIKESGFTNILIKDKDGKAGFVKIDDIDNETSVITYNEDRRFIAQSEGTRTTVNEQKTMGTLEATTKSEIKRSYKEPDPMQSLSKILNSKEKTEIFIGFNASDQAIFITADDFMNNLCSVWLNGKKELTMVDAQRAFYLEGELSNGKKFFVFDDYILHPKPNEYDKVITELLNKVYKNKNTINAHQLSIFLIPVVSTLGTEFSTD